MARRAVPLRVGAPLASMVMHPCKALSDLIDDGWQLHVGAQVVVHHDGGDPVRQQGIGQVAEIAFVAPTPIPAVQKHMHRRMGLGGLALAMLGADVVLADVAEVLPLLRTNYERNLSPAALRGEF